jgi:hypothetical protein
LNLAEILVKSFTPLSILWCVQQGSQYIRLYGIEFQVNGWNVKDEEGSGHSLYGLSRGKNNLRVVLVSAGIRLQDLRNACANLRDTPPTAT